MDAIGLAPSTPRPPSDGIGVESGHNGDIKRAAHGYEATREHGSPHGV